MGKKTLKLPQRLYVYREEDGKDVYLLAYEDIRDTVDRGEKDRTVGVYELQQSGHVEFEIKTDLPID